MMEAIQSIITPFFSLLQTPMPDFAEKKLRLRLPKIPFQLLLELIKTSEKTFIDEPTVLKLNGPIYVVGCLHGHLLDLIEIMRTFGPPPRTHYLFLGNMINYGEFSLETIILIFAMKICYPESIHVLRGSEETKDACNSKEFCTELVSEYDQTLFQPFLKVFSSLPLAAVVDGLFLCVSGGFGPNTSSIDAIAAIKRPSIHINTPELIEILFSDPTDFLPWFMPSPRGFGNVFGTSAVDKFIQNERLTSIIRGRQIEDGVKMHFDGCCASVCSASGVNGNKPAVIELSEGLMKIHGLCPLANLQRIDVVFITSENDSMYKPLHDSSRCRSKRLSVGKFLVNGCKLTTVLSQPPERKQSLVPLTKLTKGISNANSNIHTQRIFQKSPFGFHL